VTRQASRPRSCHGARAPGEATFFQTMPNRSLPTTAKLVRAVGATWCCAVAVKATWPSEPMIRTVAPAAPRCFPQPLAQSSTSIKTCRSGPGPHRYNLHERDRSSVAGAMLTRDRHHATTADNLRGRGSNASSSAEIPYARAGKSRHHHPYHASTHHRASLIGAVLCSSMSFRWCASIDDKSYCQIFLVLNTRDTKSSSAPTGGDSDSRKLLPIACPHPGYVDIAHVSPGLIRRAGVAARPGFPR
jgi:hypothetical protein